MIILCVVFLCIHFCDLKMAHGGRNMSSVQQSRIQDSCVLTYPTPSLIACNTTGMMHLKVRLLALLRSLLGFIFSGIFSQLKGERQVVSKIRARRVVQSRTKATAIPLQVAEAFSLRGQATGFKPKAKYDYICPLSPPTQKKGRTLQNSFSSQRNCKFSGRCLFHPFSTEGCFPSRICKCFCICRRNCFDVLSEGGENAKNDVFDFY